MTYGKQKIQFSNNYVTVSKIIKKIWKRATNNNIKWLFIVQIIGQNEIKKKLNKM